ncbi:MAG: DUF3604 domain-containing protein [Kiritimatiellae bacterium]|nr:DUF3604 domain-containing protein [Kiritimatiellia bacterium]
MRGIEPEVMPAWTRPIRIPAGVDVNHTEPPHAIAGERGTWRLPFTLCRDVAGGSVLKVQLWGGRNNKGVFAGAQADAPGAAGYMSAELDDGTRLTLQPDTKGGTFVVSMPATGLAAGRRVTVVLGDRAGGGSGCAAPHDRLLNKFMVLYALPAEQAEPKFPSWAGISVWAEGTAHLIVGACTMHVLGGEPDRLRAYVPAQTAPNQPFTVLVRPEDRYGNLSCRRAGEISLTLNGARLPVQIEPASPSTAVRLRTTLPDAGLHRLRVEMLPAGLRTETNPTVCSASVAGPPVYWGMIHGHTEMSDGTGTLEQYFDQLRNEAGLDFAAPGDHDHRWETSDALWHVTCEAVKRWHEPGEFVTFLGYEWAKWRKNGDGDRNVYYLDDDRPLYRSDDQDYPAPPDLFAVLARHNEKAIVIPHHTGHGGNFCDWKDHSPAHERLVEIFQVRGGYECAEAEGNPAPERPSPHEPYADGLVCRALALGWRVGFTGGGDDHGGHWGTEHAAGPAGYAYKQGLMSVEAHACTREAIFEALYNRRVVATTGTRMLLTYTLNGHPMGSELSLTSQPELADARRLEVTFHGTGPVQRVDVIRNNQVVHSVPGAGGPDLALTWADTTPISATWLPPARFCSHPFCFYYVRVVQTDADAAWASPVWIEP